MIFCGVSLGVSNSEAVDFFHGISNRYSYSFFLVSSTFKKQDFLKIFKKKFKPTHKFFSFFSFIYSFSPNSEPVPCWTRTLR